CRIGLGIGRGRRLGPHVVVERAGYSPGWANTRSDRCGCGLGSLARNFSPQVCSLISGAVAAQVRYLLATVAKSG
ncbi:MAG TPA: hypothetical protein VEX13_02295, partial [Chloroflexia bacterium]|nr:hypothetical protein [Chloroflexia bacterium]